MSTRWSFALSSSRLAILGFFVQLPVCCLDKFRRRPTVAGIYRYAEPIEIQEQKREGVMTPFCAADFSVLLLEKAASKGPYSENPDLRKGP